MGVIPWYEKDLSQSIRIVINEQQRKVLNVLAEREGVSLAKLVRYLLAEAVETEETK